MELLMRNFSINYHDCRIIFLDLEFYVPESSRRTKGLSYNPWDPDCKLLGGSFFVSNPTKDFESHLDIDSDQIQSFWLWNYDSEKALLIDIFNLLKQVSQDAKAGNDGRVSATLCGIGIISSDIPVIFDLLKRYELLSNAEAFYFQTEFRVIDVSNLAIPTFNHSSMFAYPKTKKDLLLKYISGKKFESGTAVWNLYEKAQYNEIEYRTNDEISCTHKIYSEILNNYKLFKRLEKEDKRNKYKENN